MDAITADLVAEHASLDALVAALPPEAWEMPTPAEGWAVRDQISHLWFFDDRAVLAATAPDAFVTDAKELLASTGDPSVAHGRSVAPAELLEDWRAGRARVVAGLKGPAPHPPIGWARPPRGGWRHGPLARTWPMPWVCTACPPPGFGTWPTSACGPGRSPPRCGTHPYPAGGCSWRSAGAGGGWRGGDAARPDRVTGPALDFCLVVTQRRHVDDTAVVTDGPLAEDW